MSRRHTNNQYPPNDQYPANNAHRKTNQAHSMQKAPTKPNRGMRIILVILIVVFVAELVAAYFLVSSKLKTTPQTTQTDPAISTKTETPATTDRIVMTLNGSKDTYVKLGESYVEGSCHAVDLDEGDITKSIKTSGNVDANKAGDYTITYTATNSKGQTSQCARTVHVVADMATNTTGVPVLMYHYVYTVDDQPDSLNGNYILDTDFEAQLQYLTSNGYYYPSYQELSEYIAGRHSLPEKSIFLTFDDGEGGFIAYGIPLLEKYGVYATSFLVTWDNAAPATSCPSVYITYQTHSDNMHRGGGTQGHGGVISAMTQQEIYDDLTLSMSKIGTSEAFAYPFGDNTETAWAAVTQAGILCAFTTDYGKVCVGDNPAALDRIRVQGQNSLDSFIASIS